LPNSETGDERGVTIRHIHPRSDSRKEGHHSAQHDPNHRVYTLGDPFVYPIVHPFSLGRAEDPTRRGIPFFTP